MRHIECSFAYFHLFHQVGEAFHVKFAVFNAFLGVCCFFFLFFSSFFVIDRGYLVIIFFVICC
jgi:hypothetical protein